MRYVIVDLEATCWPNARNPDDQEIIEIGAVHLAHGWGPDTDEFSRFVRPVRQPVLSDFCRDLTSIQQSDVDRADTFPVVFEDFLNWIGPESFILCSWGDYDVIQFRVDCERHSLTFPEAFASHINLKKEFSRVFGTRARGLKEALAHAGLHFEGRHHRGVDDARNVGRLATMILPQLEQAGLIELNTDESEATS